MEQEDDEVVNENFNDTGEYSSKSELSKAELVDTQARLCNINRSKEMREGYNNYDKYGNKMHIADSRQEYVNSVIALKITLKPEILRNKEIFDEAYYIKKEKILVDMWGVDYGNNKKRIPLLDEVFFEQTKLVKNKIYSGTTTSVGKKGIYNSNFHHYWNDMVFLYDEIYSKLHLLIDKCDYFKEQISY
jgi:hypothetical protein